MAEKTWEPDVMLDRYIYDYFVKRELHESAKAFMSEAKAAAEPVEIDAPGGFLYEWWSIVWDMYAARYNQKCSESAAAYLEAKERQAREHQQQIEMQQMQMLQQRNIQLLRRDPINPSLGGPLGAMNANEMLGQPSAAATVVARKMYEEHMKNPQLMGSIASTSVIDAGNLALLKSAANQQSQSLHVNAMGMSADLRKMDCRSQLANDIRPERNLNGAQRPLPMDPASVCGQAFMQSTGSCVAVSGLNQGVPIMPLNGWPLTIQESDRPQAQLIGHNNLNNQTRIMMGHSQAHGGFGNSSTYVDTNSHKSGGGPRRSASAKNELSTRYDTSMRSPSQSSSPKMNRQQERNASSQQLDHPQEQKLQNNNKRKHPSFSGPATSTGYGNTSSRSPNSPSSTQTPGEGTTNTPTNPQPANSSGNTMMYRRAGSPGLLSSYDHLEDINTLEDLGFLDDNVELFLNDEGGDGYNTQSSMQLKTDTSKDSQLHLKQQEK